MTTRQPIVNASLLGGIDTTQPPHLLDNNTFSWLQDAHIYDNRLRQVPLMKLQGLMPTGEPYAAFVLPTPYGGHCHYVVFTNNLLVQLRPAAPGSSVFLAFEDGSLPVLDFTSTRRPATVVYNGCIWYTSLNTQLQYTDGTRVVQDAVNPQPCAVHLESFFDHLCVAKVCFNGEYSPTRLMISDLYKPTIWTPSAENEADQFDFVEWVDGDSAELGITGLRRLGDLLVVYTPDAILGCQYKGLPKVFEIAPIDTTIGNSYEYALASNGSTHFFYDEKVRDFFRLDKNGPVSIGEPIKDLFLRTGNASSRRSLYSQVLPEFHEVWWRVADIVDGLFYVYNWKMNKWTVRQQQVESPIKYLSVIGPRGGFRAKTVAELAGDVASLASGCYLLSDTSLAEGETGRLFFNTEGSVYRQQERSDNPATLVPGPIPYMETGDRVYGDAFTVKETDSITIHAMYMPGTNTGIQVYLSTRANIGDTVSYTFLGTWTLGLAHKRLTFPKQAGVIFRWRFVFKDDVKPSGFEFYGFQEHIYGGKAER